MHDRARSLCMITSFSPLSQHPLFYCPLRILQPLWSPYLGWGRPNVTWEQCQLPKLPSDPKGLEPAHEEIVNLALEWTKYRLLGRTLYRDVTPRNLRTMWDQRMELSQRNSLHRRSVVGWPDSTLQAVRGKSTTWFGLYCDWENISQCEYLQDQGLPGMERWGQPGCGFVFASIVRYVWFLFATSWFAFFFFVRNYHGSFEVSWIKRM